jgi:hypothetical protein
MKWDQILKILAMEGILTPGPHRRNDRVGAVSSTGSTKEFATAFKNDSRPPDAHE